MTTRIKKMAAGLPRTRAELELLVASTVLAQTQREELVAKRDAARLAADEPYAGEITRRDDLIAANMVLIELYAEQHRDDFGDSRSIEVQGHRIGWRLGNWKTALKAKVKWDNVVACLQDLAGKGLRSNASESALARAMIAGQMLRTKVEANKDVMIDGRDKPEVQDILDEAGVTIVQDETFFLAPNREGQAEPTLKAA